MGDRHPGGVSSVFSERAEGLDSSKVYRMISAVHGGSLADGLRAGLLSGWRGVKRQVVC